MAFAEDFPPTAEDFVGADSATEKEEKGGND